MHFASGLRFSVATVGLQFVISCVSLLVLLQKTYQTGDQGLKSVCFEAGPCPSICPVCIDSSHFPNTYDIMLSSIVIKPENLSYLTSVMKKNLIDFTIKRNNRKHKFKQTDYMTFRSIL